MGISFPSELRLENGARVGVIGGGPAGSFFSLFLLSLAERVGLEVQVEMYEPRDFTRVGPRGCNMCGGIVSESLVESLAMEGIVLPDTVVQRGIDSYVLHTEEGYVQIDTPLEEKRIAAVHRGSGPRGDRDGRWQSLDGFLQGLAIEKGAGLLPERVTEVHWHEGRPEIRVGSGTRRTYDLVAVAAGVNSTALRLFEGLETGYEPPKTTKTVVREYRMGSKTLAWHLGSSMHVFLQAMPEPEFAAVIPKGDYVTVCLLGDGIDQAGAGSFLQSPLVRRCFPEKWEPDDKGCQCSPSLNVKGAVHPYADRIVFIGDSGVTRLYKDGIGAAYRTAKAAAATAVLEGISSGDFEKHYEPVCRSINRDNFIGRVIFAITRQIRKRRFARAALMCMVTREQKKRGGRRRMSMVMWDTFTGSAPYKAIFLRTLHPFFVLRFCWACIVSLFSRGELGRKG